MVPISIDQFIARANAIHNNVFDYSKSIYSGTLTNIVITCKIHGDFKQVANNHLSGSGCPTCHKEKFQAKNNASKITMQTFLERSVKSHSITYDYSLVNLVNINSKVIIVCPTHGQFLQTPKLHMKGVNCYQCSLDIKSKDNAFTLERFIQKAKETHGDKYDYSKVVYKNSNTSVEIICPVHNSFFQKPIAHTIGRGCKKCGRISSDKSSAATKITTEEFIARSIATHGDRYDYSKSICDGAFSRVEIICKLHGQFMQTANLHYAGHNCPECGKEVVGSILRLTKEEFLEKSIFNHGTKYNYDEVSFASKFDKVKIICLKHGPFWQRVSIHMKGHGCRKCTKGVSKIESEWLDSIGLPDDKEHRNVTKIVNKRVFILDGFDPESNTAYEFYGDFWHGNPLVYDPDKINNMTKTTFKFLFEKTINKENYLKANGLNVVSIWESDFRKSKVKKNL